MPEISEVLIEKRRRLQERGQDLSPKERDILIRELGTVKVPEIKEGVSVTPTRTQTPGLFGVRPKVRKFMEERVPAPGRLAVEMGVPTAGTIIGAGLGGLVGGPPGVFIGGILGGLGAELLGQETGVEEESITGIIFSGLAPLFGPAIRTTGRLGAKFISKGPLARRATRILESENIIKEASSVADSILPKTPSSRLYAGLSKMKAAIDPREFNNVRRVSSDILEQIPEEVAGAFPEGRAIRGLAQKIPAIFNPERFPHGTMPFHETQNTIQLIGRMVGALEMRGGVKEGTSKLFYRAFMEDLDKIAISADTPIKTRGAIRLFSQARQAFKSEKSAEELTFIVSGATKTTPILGGETINMARVLDQVKKLTDPKSRLFDKNFTAGLGPQKDTIINWIAKSNERLALSSLGAGELIVAGRWAALGAGIGGTIGSFIAGGAGAAAGTAIGALAGTHVPYLISRALLTPKGRIILDMLIDFSTRKMNPSDIRKWQAVSQSLGKMIGKPQLDIEVFGLLRKQRESAEVRPPLPAEGIGGFLRPGTSSRMIK